MTNNDDDIIKSIDNAIKETNSLNLSESSIENIQKLTENLQMLMNKLKKLKDDGKVSLDQSWAKYRDLELEMNHLMDYMKYLMKLIYDEKVVKKLYEANIVIKRLRSELRKKKLSKTIKNISSQFKKIPSLFTKNNENRGGKYTKPIKKRKKYSFSGKTLKDKNL